jgi:hypothetical protein
MMGTANTNASTNYNATRVTKTYAAPQEDPYFVNAEEDKVDEGAYASNPSDNHRYAAMASKTQEG